MTSYSKNTLLNLQTNANNKQSIALGKKEHKKYIYIPEKEYIFLHKETLDMYLRKYMLLSVSMEKEDNKLDS